ncbi:MAG: C1 family peptidase [Methanospirillum sp.]|uniref:C1 family peptidase n=1 Tax=Methanospirillum sp. TaxID=45200 RepID=UPI0023723511|nr:C1 family peptidase [Methanospirillum sp.]MDD1728286.1 C1 family peptidase [Methanospirillum sp.]
MVIVIIILVMGWLVSIPCPGQGVNIEETDNDQAVDSRGFESSASEVHVESQNLPTPKTTWKPGVTSLSNLTDEQKKKFDSLQKHPINQTVISATGPIMVPADLPVSFDWRDNQGDWTTPVHDQGEECGSCWAYAAISILESYLKIKSQDPDLRIGLSEQYLISCDADDDGCDGGDFETAMPYLVDTPGPDGVVGVVSKEDYPYTEQQDTCKNLAGMKRYHADKWAYVNASSDEGNENSVPPVDELKAAIYLKGPIAVGIQDDDDFDDYSGGIFSSDTTYEDTNHAVVLVGWGSEDGEDYFIGKNSAGTEWGEDGWFRIDVNSNRIGEGAVYLDSI